MHIHLWIRNRNAVFIESQFNFLSQIKLYWPIVFCSYPGAYHKVYAAGSQLTHSNNSFRFRQYPFILANDSSNNIARFFDVVAVTDAEYHVDAAGLTRRVIDNVTAVDCTGWHDYFLVISRAHNGRAYMHSFHPARGSSGFDKIAGFEWAEHPEEKTCGEILQ